MGAALGFGSSCLPPFVMVLANEEQEYSRKEPFLSPFSWVMTCFLGVCSSLGLFCTRMEEWQIMYGSF